MAAHEARPRPGRRRSQDQLGVYLRLLEAAHHTLDLDELPIAPQEHRHERVRRPLAPFEHVGRRRIERERRSAVLTDDPGGRLEDAGAERAPRALADRYGVPGVIRGDDGDAVAPRELEAAGADPVGPPRALDEGSDVLPAEQPGRRHLAAPRIGEVAIPV